MSEDIRSITTKKEIRRCFFILLKEKPIKKITVKDLCDLVNINRSTFYRYFLDIYDLLDYIELDLMKAFKRYVDEIKQQSTNSAIKTMVLDVKNNSELYIILSSENADTTFVNKMVTASYDIFKEGFKIRYPNLKPNQREWLYFMLAHGCINIITYWISTGMNENPEEITKFISKIDEILLKSENFI